MAREREIDVLNGGCVINCCFQKIEVRNSHFAAFIDMFTSNTYICVVMSNSEVASQLMAFNINNSRIVFEHLEKDQVSTNDQRSADNS